MMPILSGRRPGDEGKSLSGTDIWRTAALQISPWGETQASNWNLLQCLFSLGWGMSAADEALYSLDCHLFFNVHWGRDAASAPVVAALAGPLYFKN